MNKKVKTNYALLSVLTSALLLTGCGCAEHCRCVRGIYAGTESRCESAAGI